MWPFKKNPDPVNRFIVPFPMGARFNYLGVRLVVTCHWQEYVTATGIRRNPRLYADYVDAHGVIRNVSFSERELPALMAENMRPE